MPTSAPLRPRIDELLNWKRVLAWYATVLTVGTLGTYLAYGPFGSEAWRVYEASDAWKRDAFRLFFSSTIIVLAVGSASIVRFNKRPVDISLTYAERMLLALIVLCTVASVAPLAESFKSELATRYPDTSFSFRDIYAPYVPYLFYMLAIWVGLGFPVLVDVMRTVRDHVEWHRELDSTLNALNQSLQQNEEEQECAIAEYNGLWTKYQVGCKRFCELYLSACLIIILSLSLNYLTPIAATVTPLSLEIAKSGLLIITCVALPAYFCTVAFLYHAMSSRLLEDIDGLQECNPRNTQRKQHIDQLKRTLKLDSRASSFTVMVNTLNNSTCFLGIAGTLIIYAASGIRRGEDIWSIFLPQWLLDFVSQFIGP